MTWRTTLVASAVTVAALTLTHGMAYRAGVRHENANRRAEVAELVREQTQRLAEIDQANRTALAAEQARRANEQAQHQADMAALDAKHTKEMQDERTKTEAAVAAVRAGAVRVRDRLTCSGSAGAASTSGAGTAAGGPTSVGDAGAQRGLQGADVELVLRIAGEADEVTRQLQACQAIVKVDRVRASSVRARVGGAP